MRLVVQNQVGTQFFADRPAFVVAPGRHNECSRRFRQLDHGRTDASRTTVHEHHFTRSKTRVQEQSHMSGQANQCSCRRFGIGLTGGDRIKPPFIDRGKFRKRTASTEQPLITAPNAVAHFEPFDFTADFFDRSGKIRTHNIRKTRDHRNDAGPNVGVDRIDGDGTDFDKNLRRFRIGRRQFTKFDGRWCAGLSDKGGFQSGGSQMSIQRCRSQFKRARHRDYTVNEFACPRSRQKFNRKARHAKQ